MQEESSHQESSSVQLLALTVDNGPRPEEPPWSKMAVRIQHLQPGIGPCRRDQRQNITVPKGIAANDPTVLFFFISTRPGLEAGGGHRGDL